MTPLSSANAGVASGFPLRDRTPELDGIRGLAVVFILIWHYVAIPSGLDLHPDRWLPTFNQSLIIFKSGVDLFFVLSGFLITGILLDNSSSPSYYRTFYLRRILRIFPLYYALVLAFFIARLLGAGGPLFVGSIPMPAYVTMTQNYFMAASETYGAPWLGATWSLAIEEQFYLLFPLLVRWAGARLPRYLGAGIILSPILRIICYHHFGNDWASYTWLPCRLDSLCWGGLVAWVVRTSCLVAWIDQNRQVIIGATVSLMVGALALAAALGRNISYHMSYWGHSLLAALYALMIALALMYQGRRHTALLRTGLLLHMGRISYGVYLFHGIVLIAVFSFVGQPVSMRTGNGPWLIALSLITTVAICSFSYRWFEQPLLRISHRFPYAKN